MLVNLVLLNERHLGGNYLCYDIVYVHNHIYITYHALGSDISSLKYVYSIHFVYSHNIHTHILYRLSKVYTERMKNMCAFLGSIVLFVSIAFFYGFSKPRHTYIYVCVVEHALPVVINVSQLTYNGNYWTHIICF